MRFTIVILSALLCLHASAEFGVKNETSDEDIVAAAEKLVAEGEVVGESGTSTEADGQTEATVGEQGAAATDTTTEALASNGKEIETSAIQEAAKESEIPVFTKSEKVAKSEGTLIYRLLGSLAFIAVLGGALIWAGRRYKKQKDKGGEKARIEIMHQYHLGPKRSIALVRVAGEAVLIGCTDHSVNLLKTITLIDDELQDNVMKDFNGFLGDDFTIEDMRTALQPRS